MSSIKSSMSANLQTQTMLQLAAMVPPRMPMVINGKLVPRTKQLSSSLQFNGMWQIRVDDITLSFNFMKIGPDTLVPKEINPKWFGNCWSIGEEGLFYLTNSIIFILDWSSSCAVTNTNFTDFST